jgi:transposase
MIKLPEKAITELQEIYKKEFGIKLSHKTAYDEAVRLLKFSYELLKYLQNSRKEGEEI